MLFVRHLWLRRKTLQKFAEDLTIINFLLNVKQMQEFMIQYDAIKRVENRRYREKPQGRFSGMKS